MFDLNTRIKINNSKIFADNDKSIVISDLLTQTNINLRIDNSQHSANSFKSISLLQIQSILNNEIILNFNSNTRVEIDNRQHMAAENKTINIDEVVEILNISEGGGGGYTAQAVNFDGTAGLISDNLVTSDSPFATFSLWVSGDVLLGDDLGYWEVSIGNVGEIGSISAQFWSVSGEDYFSFHVEDLPPFIDWALVQIAVDTNHPAGEKIALVTIDGVSQSLTLPSDDAGDAFSVGWTFSPAATNVPFVTVGPYTTITDAADWWIAFGQFIDITTAPNIAKFIDGDGKPVGLGADGSTPTGIAPTIFFSGTTSTFAQPNLGTGGAFTLTGVLINANF